MLKSAIPLFRFAGIRVYLHFSWFIIAFLEVTQFAHRYHEPVWGLYEYLALFGIVLLHEFGHALACRQTGGEADRIVLWPLGGVAFVNPPPRAGAYLWSIAAGPLVNVLLVPVFVFISIVSARWQAINPDHYRFVQSLWMMNLGLLIFNLLPVYPLDGGQIVRGLLWLLLGPIRSLKIASVIGFIGAFGFAVWAFAERSIWLGVLAFFIFAQAQVGWRAAQALESEAYDAARAEAATSPPPLPEQRA